MLLLGLLPGRALFGTGEVHVPLVYRREEGLHAVVVGMADRVELMIVTACAAQRDAEKCRTDDVRHLGEDFVTARCHFLVPGVLAQRPQALETGGRTQLGVRR